MTYKLHHSKEKNRWILVPEGEKVEGYESNIIGIKHEDIDEYFHMLDKEGIEKARGYLVLKKDEVQGKRIKKSFPEKSSKRKK